MYDELDAICQFADEQAAVSGVHDTNRCQKVKTWDLKAVLSIGMTSRTQAMEAQEQGKEQGREEEGKEKRVGTAQTGKRKRARDDEGEPATKRKQ